MDTTKSNVAGRVSVREAIEFRNHCALTLYFDGATEPVNPRGWSTYGWCILSETGEEIASGHGVAAKAGEAHSTNNFAEYTALGKGLRYIVDRGWQGRLKIRGDSALVVNQVSGSWNCNKEHLIRLRDRVRELLKTLGGAFEIAWVPREQNERCDALSRLAYTEATGQPFPERRKKG